MLSDEDGTVHAHEEAGALCAHAHLVKGGVDILSDEEGNIAKGGVTIELQACLMRTISSLSSQITLVPQLSGVETRWKWRVSTRGHGGRIGST